jgi:hypothetical protein
MQFHDNVRVGSIHTSFICMSDAESAFRKADVDMKIEKREKLERHVMRSKQYMMHYTANADKS